MKASSPAVRTAALLAALLLVASFGCAPKKAPSMAPASPEAAWQVFRQNYCTPVSQPGMLVKASLYYTRITPTRRTNRTLVSMWGDFSGPMRLDISAGIGKLLAHIREDRDGLLVFYPTEKTAYAHGDSVLGATRLGMPFPFSLTELARVTVGDFSGLTPKGFIEARRTNDGFAYKLHGAQVASIALDDMGRPRMLEGETSGRHATARTWRLEINTYEDDVAGVPLPDRLTLSMDNGETGVLRIKARELKVTPWTAKATDLTLPEGIVYYRLDNGPEPVGITDIPIVHEDKP